ncbi:unnamed protein product [Diamesa serratosioi]
MFICHLLLALVGLLGVRGSAKVEDKVMTRRLLDYFEEALNHDQNIVVNREKREALVDVLESSVPSLFALRHFTLNHHYWTRKRGSDRTSFENDTGMKNMNFRKKRAILEKILKEKTVELREGNSNSTERNSTSKHHHAKGKRSLNDLTEQYELPTNANDDQVDYKVKREINKFNDSLSQVTATFTSNSPTKPTPKKISDSQEHRNNINYRKRFDKCCNNDDNDIAIRSINKTVAALRNKCVVEIKKKRHSNGTTDDEFEGDGGIFDMYSCDRVNRRKSEITCIMDCIGQKTGVIDKTGKFDVNVAKQMILENYAIREWEKSTSDKLVEKCIAGISSLSKPIDAYGYQCSSHMAQFAYCMWREFFLSCPIDKQHPNKQCEKLRTVITRKTTNQFGN